jgi:acyl dehydratase
MELADLAGTSLGERTISFDDRTTILYALCAGARPDELELVWEHALRPMPSLATALGLWAVEAAGDLGAYDRTRSLHVGQRLVASSAMPPAGEIAMTGHVDAVWDKGRAAIVEIGVRSEYFELGYTIFLPGMGGFGGVDAPKPSESAPLAPVHSTDVATTENLALLYRLTGDRHPVHVDPDTAGANGFDRPILHGLCTLAIAAHSVATTAGRHPAELSGLSARLAAPVTPGETLTISSEDLNDHTARFEVAVADRLVLKDGVASFISSQ